jgi:radical SAM superfamily enzyme YgiQ (UPF0313 family)
MAKERGAVRKDRGGRISVALVFPNLYRVGMSNLGFQVVYALMNQREDVVAERVFLPEIEKMSLVMESGKGLLSVESLSPLSSFDLVAFSLSFENDYPHILKILKLGKIPLFSQERDGSHPLVMAGGITTFLNPEPLSPFFDFFLLGEAEGVLDLFFDLFRDLRDSRAPRGEILRTLARKLRSLYVPSLYRCEHSKDGTIRSWRSTEAGIPEKIIVHRGGTFPVSKSSIIAEDTPFADRVLIELGRGCGRACRFCAAGYVYRPPRFHEQAALVPVIEEALGKGEPMGLMSACLSDVPGIEALTRRIADKGGRFSMSSMRADSLTPTLMEQLWKVGQRTITLAPEAGSERLRKVINKHLTRDQITEAVQMVARTGDFSLRLYFLIGLPTETMEDVEDILRLVKDIKHHMVREASTRGKIRQIKLSINSFIPKPFTPFQWFPLEEVTTLKKKQRWLSKALGKEGGIKASFDVPKWAYVQSLLSMGDRRVSAILTAVHQCDGDWSRAFRSTDLNPDFFVYRSKSLDEVLPWDFIDHGIRKEHLIKEYNLALREEESDTCRIGQCRRCGICQ